MPIPETISQETPHPQQPTPARPRPNRWWSVAFWVALFSPVLGIGALLLIAATGDLPDTETLANPRTDLATRIYSTDGKILGSYYRENRSDVRFESLPGPLIDALICTEDVRYNNHTGVDFKALARAIAFMGKRGGGSTITQQLAKLLFTESYMNTGFFERAVLQKPREWIIATRLERQYTKAEIIALYLNRYDFLNQAVGIESAAQIYFGKTADELELHESAMLVGMLKNSALFNPLRRPELVTRRRGTVLAQMERYGVLTSAERDSVQALPLDLSFHRASHAEGPAPHFREMLRQHVRDLLKQKTDDDLLKIAKADGSAYDLYRDGLVIHTTIDSRLQRYAEEGAVRHVKGELQGELWNDLKLTTGGDWPFYPEILPEDRARIMNFAVTQSTRYRMLAGKQCPSCERPGFYIAELDSAWSDDIDRVHFCRPEKGGCGHAWPVLSRRAIDKNFRQKTPTQVMGLAGLIDTVMSPLDSIHHQKTLLHMGLVSLDPMSGAIRAWVGDLDYRWSQYDNVNLSKRQVGSTFKPFVYATAIRHGMDPCTEVPNQVTCIDMPGDEPPWCPDNSDKEYGEMVTLEYALANSMNTVTAKLIKDFGVQRVVELAHEMGIESYIPPYPSIALGVAELNLLEVTSANATFAGGGVWRRPQFIQRIEDKRGNTIYEPRLELRQGLDAATAYRVLNMMEKVVTGAYNEEKDHRRGTGMRLRMDVESRAYDNVRIPVAGKTGTTQNNSDGWFLGLTPELVTGVWVGAADPAVRFSTTHKGQGANTALPIFGFYINAALADSTIGLQGLEFRPPEGVLKQPDCEELIKARALDFDDDDLFD